MITFYLVRHGETTWNRSGRFQGNTDIHLSSTGLKQAEKTAEWFQDKPIDAVYSSNLSRAVETAGPIADMHHLQVQKADALQELHFGKWEGLTFPEIDERWPGLMEQLIKHPDVISPPEGESFFECEKRTMKFLKKIAEDQVDRSYVLVSHGAALRTMICGLMDFPLKSVWQLSMENASISCITSTRGFNVLHFLNLIP